MTGPEAAYDEQGKKKRLDWTREEALLAFDVYVRSRAFGGGPVPGQSSQEVVTLSEYLQSVPIHPRSMQYPAFRNVSGVYQKLLNIRHAEKLAREQRGLPVPESMRGKAGRSKGGQADREVVDEFFDDHDALAREAEAIRATLNAGAVPAPPPGGSDDEVILTDAPPDGGGGGRVRGDVLDRWHANSEGVHPCARLLGAHGSVGTRCAWASH